MTLFLAEYAPADRIEVVRSDEDLWPWDVVANLQAYGGGWKVAALERLIVEALNYYVPPTVPCSEGRKDARGMQQRCVPGK